MRSSAVLLAVLVAVGITGCTAATASPATTPPPAVPTTAPTSATLTADGTFEQPILCRSVVDYETTQAAIGTGKLTTVHQVAALAATDGAAGLASSRAHTWSADVRPLLQPYLAARAQQVQYFQAVARSTTVAAATAIPWPDATPESSPVYAAIGIPGDLTCPKP